MVSLFRFKVISSFVFPIALIYFTQEKNGTIYGGWFMGSIVFPKLIYHIFTKRSYREKLSFLRDFHAIVQLTQGCKCHENLEENAHFPPGPGVGVGYLWSLTHIKRTMSIFRHWKQIKVLSWVLFVPFRQVFEYTEICWIVIQCCCDVHMESGYIFSRE